MSSDTQPARRVRWLPVVVFVGLAYALAWLVCLPLWSGGGLQNPAFPLLALAMMTTPAAAALVVSLTLERRAWRHGPRPVVQLLRHLGLLPRGRWSWGRTLGLCALTAGLVAVLCLAALPLGVVFGVIRPDLVHLSGFRALLDAQTHGAAGDLPLPLWVLALSQLTAVVPGGLINAVPALGEEIGWRGWLLPRLLPLGRLPAIVVGGVVWGAWHAPLLLLGYNYPDAPRWAAVPLFCGFCVLFGGVLAWARLRSGSVWAPAVGHGVLNAGASVTVVFAAAGHPVNTVWATPIGLTGWIAVAACLVVLLTRAPWAPERV